MILYKKNNLGLISWWEIEVVEDAVPSAPTQQPPTSVASPQECLAATVPIGYNVWWGSDHTTRTRQTDNHQFTPASDKPSLSVTAQIESAINEMIARKGYSREIPSAPPELPMLAQTWADFQSKASSDQSEVAHWPDLYFQPKLDGVRCIATPLNLYSRRNLPFTSVPHIEMAMQLLLNHPEFSSIKLDGELYYHNTDLQTIQGIVSRKSYDPFLYREVTYQVFDVVAPLPYKERLTLLNRIEAELRYLWYNYSPPENLRRHRTTNCPVQFVPTGYLNMSTDNPTLPVLLQKMNNEFRSEGYEGIILRNPHALYQPDYRTFDLLKYKEFADAEFIILDVLEAKNGCVFLCRTLNNKTFKVSPAWTTARKRQALNYKDNYIGRRLTVKYERLSADGIPLKPIGISTRND